MPPGHPLTEQQSALVELTVSGSVDDLEPDKERLRDAFAALSGVEARRVLVDLKSASVIITVSILGDDSEAVVSVLQTSLSSAANATSALAAQGLNVTVLVVSAPPDVVWVYAPALAATARGPSSMDTTTLVIVLGGAGGLLVGVIMWMRTRRGAADRGARLVDGKLPAGAAGRGIDMYGSAKAASQGGAMMRLQEGHLHGSNI